LDGAAAALLKMDDLQGRVGTPGALVRPGTKPESSVPVPAVPVVKAARLPATTAADRALVPKLATVLLRNPDGCQDVDSAQDPLDVVRLDSTTLLALQPCGRGAYQLGSFTLVWRVDAQPPHKARRLGLPTPDGRTADGLVTEGLGAGTR
jgi:hypothetical protein